MRRRFGLPLLWMIVMVACAPPTNGAETELRETQFQALVGVHEFGTHFRMIKDPDYVAPKVGAEFMVAFDVENTSKVDVAFSADLGLLILVYDEVGNKWIELDNLANREPSPDTVLLADGEPWKKTLRERVRSDLGPVGNVTLLRIVVRGRIEATGEPIANYLEYIVTP